MFFVGYLKKKIYFLKMYFYIKVYFCLFNCVLG